MNKLKYLLLALLPLSLTGCGEIIDTGHRGVKTQYGEVVSESLTEGFYFYIPFVTNIVEIDTRVKRLDGEDQTYTKDVQLAKIGYTVTFNVKRDKVHIVYRDVGRDWEEKLVSPVVKNAIKAAIGKWDAVDLIANRERATNEIVENIKSALDEKNVDLTGFELTDISYQAEFEKAVEAKVTAIQRAIESQNKTVQIEEEAKQKIITAEAEAKAMKIQSDALRQSENLVQWKAIEAWNGELPKFMMGGSGAIPFISVDPKEFK